MDQKMKNFDRRIEQMMNEGEVTPPFGMWNRIAAELEAEATAVPVSVNSPIPQRAVFGLVAGALLISASLLTALLVNDYSKKVEPIASAVTITKPVAESIVATEIPTIIFPAEAKPVNPISKKKAALAPVHKNIVLHEETAPVAIQTLPVHAEVLVPNQKVAENNGATEPYYFPAIDVNNAQNKVEEKPTASIAKTTKLEAKNTDDNDREVSSYDPPRIKFRPKKHRSFTYGKIIRK